MAQMGPAEFSYEYQLEGGWAKDDKTIFLTVPANWSGVCSINHVSF